MSIQPDCSIKEPFSAESIKSLWIYFGVIGRPDVSDQPDYAIMGDSMSSRFREDRNELSADY